ncbi:glycosyltransferase family 1 protein [hot springs metagenome]|uniref:Glycosyltransferase family 1 protein n=1 Tax=hot springs metagenome TaxID=433727 RepID=A0A5J4L7Q9_9ZZZZ
MKKILILDTGKEWGGGTNSLLELLKRIDKNKYRFIALFYNNYKKGSDSNIKTEIEKLGIDVLLLEQKKQPAIAKILKELFRALFFFNRQLRKYMVFIIDYQFRIKSNAKKIANTLKDLKIDLLYMNNQPSSNLEGIIASKITGIPALQHSRIETRLNPFEVKAANLWLKKMICVSEGVKNTFVRQGIDAKKCVVVYNGIDPETKPSMPPHEVRKKWEVSENDILIGTVGSLIKRKRLKDLIEAISIAANKTDHTIKCIIIGEGTERENLVDLVKRKNLHDKVIFTGFQVDAVSYINAMDIFVLTSEKEGLPRVILEAMLMGKPVVASNVTGPAELVVDGETGFLVPVMNIDTIVNAILKLIQNPDLRNQLGEKARKRAIEHFSIEKYVTGVEKIFEEVLNH